METGTSDRVDYAASRLRVGVSPEPLAPALLLRSLRDARLVHRVAVLEVHVAVVDGLKARPAGGGSEGDQG